jgi:hypothetical protein
LAWHAGPPNRTGVLREMTWYIWAKSMFLKDRLVYLSLASKETWEVAGCICRNSRL